MNERRSLIYAVIQAGAVVFLLALEDPEFRRNVAWAFQWTRDRLRARLIPDADEPPAPDVSRVISEARAITMDPEGPTIGKAGN